MSFEVNDPHAVSFLPGGGQAIGEIDRDSHAIGEKANPATMFFVFHLLILIMLTALSTVIESSLRSMEIP